MSNASLRDNSVVFLLGAGCSADAGIPMSSTMLQRIEEKLIGDEGWKKFSKLYYYVKNTIEYGDKIGENNKDINIERLLVVLNSLVENKKAQLYPFTMGYTNDLIEYSGVGFENVKELINQITKELPGWVTVGAYEAASYYKAFTKFQQELTFSIRIFSLNYDLCIERNIDKTKLERGFSESHIWDGRRFNSSDNEETKSIYLYKMHGSIDWERKSEGGTLHESQQQNIKPDLIFGTDLKMQAIDPYLFYLYEFRQHIMSSNIIVIIGYSYNDNHINGLIKQALKDNKTRKLLNVSPDNEISVTSIIKKLGMKGGSDRVLLENISAKEFLEKKLTLENISRLAVMEEMPF